MKKTLPTKFATPREDAANLPTKEAIDYSSALAVDSVPGKMHKPAKENANIDEKVYMFPDSFNALRKELSENWPTLFERVGYTMAFDAPVFMEMMDAALNTKTTFDSAKVSAISLKYLNMLRNKRGLSSH